MESRKNEKWLFPIGINEKGFIQFIRNSIGRLFLLLNPNLEEGFFDGRHPKSKFERAAIASLVTRLSKMGKQKELATLHRKLWESKDAFQFYKTTEERFDAIFLNVKKDFDFIFDQLQVGAKMENVVEIGCGNGKILEYLYKSRTGFSKFIGLDINESQIAINQATYKDRPGFEFYACDANEWIQKNNLPNTLYLTFGGVLEYFTGEELRLFFAKICEKAATGLAIFEPLAKGFDPKENIPSVNFGAELSFSHAYSYLVKEQGMNIIFEKIESSEKGQWILMGAKK